MQLPELLFTLTAQGLRLGCAGCNTIEIAGPVERLTPELKAELREHKPRLLALLGCHNPPTPERIAIASEAQAPAEAATFNPGDYLEPCPRCDRLCYWSLAERRYRCEVCDASPKRLIGQGFPALDVEAYQERLLEPFEREPFAPTEWPCHKCKRPAYRGAFGRRYCFSCGPLGKPKIKASEFAGLSPEQEAQASAEGLATCNREGCSRPVLPIFKRKGAKQGICLTCWLGDNAESETPPGSTPEASLTATL